MSPDDGITTAPVDDFASFFLKRQITARNKGARATTHRLDKECINYDRQKKGWEENMQKLVKGCISNG